MKPRPSAKPTPKAIDLHFCATYPLRCLIGKFVFEFGEFITIRDLPLNT